MDAATDDYVFRNREWWNASSDTYQERHQNQLRWANLAWGVWAIPESILRILEDVEGRDTLEVGCGAAQSSVALAKAGANPVAVDLSDRQLHHAQQLQQQTDTAVPLVHTNAERLPFAGGSFDLVFCDYGAFLLADPHKLVAEAERVLRPGGLLAFNTTTPLLFMCWPDGELEPQDRLCRDYFNVNRIEDGGLTRFTLSYGDWIRLFRSSNFTVEDLVELRPDPGAKTSFGPSTAFEWARRWPAEHIWKARKNRK